MGFQARVNISATRRFKGFAGHVIAGGLHMIIDLNSIVSKSGGYDGQMCATCKQVKGLFRFSN